MKTPEFEKVVTERVDKIQKTLVEKAKEYVRGEDRLHNFNVGARVANTTREKVLWGFALKHYISFLDMLNDIEEGNLPKEEYVDEKIGDLINYLVLTEASIKDKIENAKLQIDSAK
jgi:hypothetical protein